MMKENKDLLLRVLCAMLPYGVIVQDRNGIHELSVGNTEFTDLFTGKCNIKPYLRPMSSMTEEEIDELKSLLPFLNGDMFVNDYEIIVFEIDGNFRLSHHLFEEVINFYNSHHLDYRGLIPKGLALKAKEGMYGKED